MNRFQKRISRKVRRGPRGWPMATIAFYGPNTSLASKVAVGVIRTEGGNAEDMQAWFSDDVDVRHDPVINQAIMDFIDSHDARTVVMGEQIMGCPHQEGIDYKGDWCPVCVFWKDRDRFTGKLSS